MTSPPTAGDFFALVRERERGKLKLYIGSAAGVGKSFRMLQEAHDLRRRGVDAVVGFIETHGRTDTAAQLGDLEVVPRRTIDYRGVRLEEMDVDAIIGRHPQVAIVDELAHSNVPGSVRAKRWEDVILLLDAGISVISAVNIQHLESLNDVVAKVLGVTVRETVPDWVMGLADQVVNVDLSAEDLRQRLQEGKIYRADKIAAAMTNFFTEENLTTLRELALREVASSVDRSREEIVRRVEGSPPRAASASRIMVAMASSPPNTVALLRKASRIAGRLNTDWYCVYVRTPEEGAARIDSDIQRRLVANIQLAQGMGAEVVTIDGTDVAETLCRFAADNGVGLIVAGQSQRPVWHRMFRRSVVGRLVLNSFGIDVMIVPMDGSNKPPNAVLRADRGSTARATADSRAIKTVLGPPAADTGQPRERPQLREPDAPESARAHDAMLHLVTAELRRQMNDVRVPLHILLENHFGDLNENQEEMLGAARLATDTAESSLRSAEAILGAADGSLELRCDRVLAGDLISGLIVPLRAVAERRGIAVNEDVQPVLGALIGDRARLQETLQTLFEAGLGLANENTGADFTAQATDGLLVLTLGYTGHAVSGMPLLLACSVLQAMGGSASAIPGQAAVTIPLEIRSC